MYAANGSNVDRLTILDSDIYGNNSDGIHIESSNDQLLVRSSRIHANHQAGLSLSAVSGSVLDNDIYANGNYGINESGPSSGSMLIGDNSIHDNTGSGVLAYYASTLLQGNQLFNTTGSSTYAAQLNGGAVADGNFVHNNSQGLLVNGSVARRNEIYANTGLGLYISGGTASGNRIYDNSSGIYDDVYSSRIENNVVYANTNSGITLNNYYSGSGAAVVNNTIYQPVGDALVVTNIGDRRSIDNNIFWVGAGYAINTGNTSPANFSSDYNLFYLANSSARVALWGGVQQPTLAAWSTATGRDAHSVTGNPTFLDIDGADNVLGEQGVSQGNGLDDNFGLSAASPAIDAANAYVAPLTDIGGLTRHDDLGTTNSGDGWPLYVATDTGSNNFATTGTAKSLRTSDSYINYALPFGFKFYGTTYTSVAINNNGFLQFEGSDQHIGNDNSIDAFLRNVRIAPLWDNLETFSSGKDVFIDATVANQVTIRWAAKLETGTKGDANFSVTLFSDGRFRFDYGAGNDGLTPTVGVSAGNGVSFVLAPYDGRGNLASADSLMWQATPGLNYFDIGAYEFQGNSGDKTPPEVTSVSNLPAPGGSTAAAFSSVQVSFSEALDGISARSPANYQLISAGPDGVFSTPDDIKIALKPLYSFPETNLTLQFGNGVLADGLYRLTLSGTKAILDTAGNKLDGNGDGVGGDDYVRTFRIDRSGNHPPVAQDATVSVNEDASVLIQLSASDADNDLLTYGIATNPGHGTLSGFDPTALTVVYTPNPNFNGADSFGFHVDDGKLGTDTGVVTITVNPVNDPPSGVNLVASTDENAAVALTLGGSDLETPASSLTFAAAAQPTHGSLTIGANGHWIYQPATNFSGQDSLQYTVTDGGDPDGTLSNALTSAPATVTINVRPVNQPPTIDPIADKVVNEGSTLSFAVTASDPENDPVTFTLLNPVPGATIDKQTGIFTWTPADGPSAQAFTVRTSDGTHTVDQTFNVGILNVAPTLTVTGAAATLVGTDYTVHFSAADPGADTITNWSVDWGDGVVTTLPGSAQSATRQFAVAGSYAIDVSATDEDGSYSAAPLELKVSSPNQPPVVQNDGPYRSGTGTTLTVSAAQGVLSNDADPNGDPLTAVLVSAPVRGSVQLNADGSFVYTPSGTSSGTVTFTYAASDGQLQSTPATVSLLLDDAPSAGDAHFSVAHNGTLTLSASNGLLTFASDPNADALSVASHTSTAHGTLSVATDGSLTYAPAPGFIGQDSFTYQVQDTLGEQVAATVTIDVVNHAPAAGADSYATQIGVPLSINPAGGVLANDSDPDGDALTAVTPSTPPHGVLTLNQNGSFTYVPQAGFVGDDTFHYLAQDSLGASTQGDVTIHVVNDKLYVQSLQATDSGFKARFSRAFDPSVLNLYSGTGGVFGASDLVLTGLGGAVAGSVVLDGDRQGLEFIATGNALADGNYRVVMKSGASAFKDMLGRPLDGDGNGVTGDDYATTFSISGGGAPIAGLPDFVRGPGQAAAQPQLAGGLPVRIYNGGSFSTLHFEVNYAPALLTLSSATSPSGGVVQADFSTPGVAAITVTFAAPVSGQGLEVVRLFGSVPSSSAYGAKQVIYIRNVALDGSRVGRGDAALEVVAYSGDATHDASYSTLDVQRMQRVITKLDTGFGEWPLVDPSVIGDTSGNGQFNSGDATLVLRQAAGVAQPEIPAIPAGSVPLQFSGADPVVSLPRALTARIGDRVTIPVSLDDSAGLESVQLRISWDADALTLLDVQRGSLTGGFQWFVQQHESGRLVVDASGLRKLAGGGGSLIELNFQVNARAHAGKQLIDLQWARLNDGHLTLDPAPRIGEDPTDGLLRILAHTDAAAKGRAPWSPQLAPQTQQVAVALSRSDDSVVDWSAVNRSLFGHTVRNIDWLDDFLNRTGTSDKERNPNNRLRIAVPRR